MELLSALLWIAIIALLWAMARAGWFKPGGIAESAVAKRYLRRLPEEYEVINDVMIATADGNTHQIDHVVISPYGIFVIETKKRTGKVYGSQYGQKWTEYIYGNDFSFYNPIRQNYGHVNALMELTDLPEKAFVPIVVFTRQTKLKISMKDEAGGHVVKTPELVDTICHYEEILITPETQQRVQDLLTESNITDRNRRREHVANIKEKHQK